MTDKLSKTKGLRHPWKKGQSGNPNGARRGIRHWHTVLRESFETGRVSQNELAQILITKAKKGDLKALQIIMDRMDGKIREMPEIKPITSFRGRTDEELMQIMIDCGAPPPKNGVEYSNEELEAIDKMTKDHFAKKHR